MFLSKPILAENKIKITTASEADLRYTFQNLKEDDVLEIEEECRSLNLTTMKMRHILMENSLVKYAAFRGAKLLFCAGLYNRDAVSVPDGYVMWWIPTKACEELKISYAKAAFQMKVALQKAADHHPIYTYTPAWYKKNYKATKDLGFKYVGDFESSGNQYRLSVMEA